MSCRQRSVGFRVPIVFLSSVTLACSADPSGSVKTTDVVSALNATPKTSDFVIEVQNSIRLQTGGLVVSGGDLGASGTTGPFLGNGAAVDVQTGVQVLPSRTIIGSSVTLGTGAKVGDIETSHLVVGTGATHGAVSGVVTLPALPAAATVSPGTTNLTVGTGATVSALPGRYATIAVGTGATLKLTLGLYDLTTLTLGTGAKLQAVGAVQLHVAGRLSTSSGATIGSAPGANLTAGKIRIEISGRNGSTGALAATPPAAALGTGNTVTALILVPNGSLVFGTGTTATGAFMGRDVDVGGAGVKLTYQDGFPNATCTQASCDDGDPCTVDTCDGTSTCAHARAGAGTSCGGGNMCDGAGQCVQCLVATTCPGVDGTCATRTCSAGACGQAFATVGTACGTGLVCNGGGSCVSACVPTTCDAAGKNCGPIPDGCRGTLDCGACTAPSVCGGSGTPNVCSVPPQNPCEQAAWRRALTSGQTSTGASVATDAAANIYVTGSTWAPRGNDSTVTTSAYVAKIDNQSNVLWFQQLSAGCSIGGVGVAVSTTGSIYLVGTTNCALPGNTALGELDMFVARYDTSGTLAWVRQFGTDKYDVAYGVATDGAGDAYIIGDTAGSFDGIVNNDGTTDLAVIKFGADGTLRWAHQLGATAPDTADGRGIAMDATGGIYAAGVTSGSFDGNASFGQEDIVLVKFDSSGNKLWSRQYGTSGFDFAHAVATDPAGNIYVTGEPGGTFSDSPTGGSVFLVKYDGAGNRLWTRQRGPVDAEALAIATDTNNGVFIGGETLLSFDGRPTGGDGDDDPFVVKYTSGGDWVWTEEDATPEYEIGAGLATGPDGSVFAVGDIIGPIDANHHRDYDASLTKIVPAVCEP
jgi:hypothetical protein